MTSKVVSLFLVLITQGNCAHRMLHRLQIDVDSILSSLNYFETEATSAVTCSLHAVQRPHAAGACYNEPRCIFPQELTVGVSSSTAENWQCYGEVLSTDENEATTDGSTTTDETETTTAANTDVCGASFTMVSGVGCCFFSTNQLTFDLAVTECRNLGGYLAVASDLQVFRQLASFIPTVQPYTHSFYVDLRQTSTGEWRWYSNGPTLIDTSYWGSKLPDGGTNELCAHMVSDNNFHLADISCYASLNYICMM